MPDKCKIRAAARAKQWRLDNPDYKDRYRETVRNIAYKKYGITTQDYDILFDKQKGRCAICDTDDLGKFKYFCVDHCHDTGKVRGLLCHTCNRALGLFKDDLTRLQNAVKYIGEN